MTDKKDKLIAELVNKGLDGDMDAVNACEDRMVRAKAKAMIVKVGKGTAERPPMPVSDAPAPATSGPVDISTLSKEDMFSYLVNKGLDGDMDAVNACEDKMTRAKAKAMIVKVGKGTAERPPMPVSDASAPATSGPVDISTLSKEDMFSYLVNKGLDGDMDAVNACEDKMTRAKAKAMIVKVGKGTAERPPMPVTAAVNDVSVDVPEDSSFSEINKDVNQKVKDMIEKEFPGSTLEGESYIQLSSEKWFEIASWLKSEESLLFDSLQCQMGIDIGEENLESRYNLHSMKHDHYVEIRLSVPRSNPKVPSVEQVWRIADWFERETYDMFGIEFVGHRDLRRILLPDDWEGWPLRKDYQEQETYHGIVVPKVKEGWE